MIQKIFVQIEIIYPNTKTWTGKTIDEARSKAHSQVENEFLAGRFNFDHEGITPTVYLSSRTFP